MKNLFIFVLLMAHFAGFAQSPTEIMVAAQNEQFISIKYSPTTKKSFVTTSTGQLFTIDINNKIINTTFFGSIGNLDLDNEGKVGAFSDENNNVTIFDQQTLAIVETFKVSTVSGQGSLRVFFTKHGIFISTFKNVYKREGNDCIKVASSYGLIDYDFNTDQFLFAKWFSALSYDRKVNELSVAKGTNLNIKRIIHTFGDSFEVYSHFMKNGTSVVTYDGKGRYYSISLMTGQKKIVSQQGLEENQRMFGLAKLNDTTIVTVCYYPNRFVFNNTKTQQKIKSLVVNETISNNQIVEREGVYTYITSGGNGNKLISIK